MSLLLRSVQTIVRQSLKAKLNPLVEDSVEAYRVSPLDIDVFRHMNNAKYLNYMEAARWGLMARTGILKISLVNGWIAPIGSLHIEYYRPLTIGQRFEIRSRIVGFEERWIHILQRFWRDDKEVARALVKSTVRKGKVNIRPAEYLQKLGVTNAEPVVPEDAGDWVRTHVGHQIVRP